MLKSFFWIQEPLNIQFVGTVDVNFPRINFSVTCHNRGEETHVGLVDCLQKTKGFINNEISLK